MPYKSLICLICRVWKTTPSSKPTHLPTICQHNRLSLFGSLRDCVGHYFHRECIAAALSHNTRCPNCFTQYGDVVGSQPPGQMTVQSHSPDHLRLSGMDCGTLQISYHFPRSVSTSVPWVYCTLLRPWPCRQFDMAVNG